MNDSMTPAAMNRAIARLMDKHPTPDYLRDRTAMAEALATLTDAELPEFLKAFRAPTESALDHFRALLCGPLERHAAAFLKAKEST